MNEATLNRLKLLVDSAVEPVIATVHCKQKMREELLAHVSTVFAEEMVKLKDEPAALERTVQRFGNPAELSIQLQESLPATGFNHNRLYNVLLIVLCLYVASSIPLLAMILAIPPELRPDLQWPDWSLPVLAVLNAAYLLVMMATLVFRLVRPTIGIRLTRIMNILFLFGPPLGTALGIYGLWKVDRDPEIGAAA